jgi:hypothetical protein
MVKVCQSCVDKLAKRLLENHPDLSEKEAAKRAEQGFKRMAKRQKREKKQNAWVPLWTRYYHVQKGIPKRKAYHMAIRIVSRLNASITSKKDELKAMGYFDPVVNSVYIPVKILDRGDIPLFYGTHKETRFWVFREKLFRWVFHGNLKAIIYWSFKLRKLTFIGNSYNPDYTQACTQSTCAESNSCSNVGDACITAANCDFGGCSFTAGCGCPAPLSNSTLTTNCSSTCASTGGACGTCVTKKCTADTCTVTNCTVGTCGYTCDVGFTWNGVACVASTKLQRNKVGVGL